MIEGNATMDVSGFVTEMIMPITATVSIVDAEIIAGKHDKIKYREIFLENFYNIFDSFCCLYLW